MEIVVGTVSFSLGVLEGCARAPCATSPLQINKPLSALGDVIEALAKAASVTSRFSRSSGFHSEKRSPSLPNSQLVTSFFGGLLAGPRSGQHELFWLSAFLPPGWRHDLLTSAFCPFCEFSWPAPLGVLEGCGSLLSLVLSLSLGVREGCARANRSRGFWRLPLRLGFWRVLADWAQAVQILHRKVCANVSARTC